MKAAAETTLAIASDPSASAQGLVSPPCCTPGLGAHPSSARAHDRARWRDLVRRHAMDRLALRLPGSHQSAGAPVPRQDAGPGSWLRIKPIIDVLQQPCRTRRQENIQALHRSAAAHQVGGLLQGAIRRARAGVALSLPLHPSRRHLEPSPRGSRRRRDCVPMERLSPQRSDRWKTMRLHPHEFIRRFLIHVLPRAFHRIRHYGLFANTNRAGNIATARALLNVTRLPPTRNSRRISPRTRHARSLPLPTLVAAA